MNRDVDHVDAFIKMFTVAGKSGPLPLQNLTFGAKDNYDVKGHVTGYGSPDWLRTHEPANTNAFVVDRLLDAGATLAGKTHTAELAYSLIGINAHYGTPKNTCAPDRVPGGSSSGSAAATAAGVVDIGLGSDTGGSVRLPAAFCGIYGMRPTHGRISMHGLLPLAPSFDTVGWFARDASTLSKVGRVLGVCEDRPALGRLLFPQDVWELADPSIASALEVVLDELQTMFGPVVPCRLSDAGLTEWRETFRICQAFEIWRELGPWILQTTPKFGPGVRERLEMASKITVRDWIEADQSRSRIAASLSAQLAGDAIIVMPTAPSLAPKKNATEKEFAKFRENFLAFLSPASLAGLPQISIPAATVANAPVGISLMSARGNDAQLLEMAGRVASKGCSDRTLDWQA
jgi:amidase